MCDVHIYSRTCLLEKRPKPPFFFLIARLGGKEGKKEGTKEGKKERKNVVLFSMTHNNIMYICILLHNMYYSVLLFSILSSRGYFCTVAVYSTATLYCRVPFCIYTHCCTPLLL